MLVTKLMMQSGLQTELRLRMVPAFQQLTETPISEVLMERPLENMSNFYPCMALMVIN